MTDRAFRLRVSGDVELTVRVVDPGRSADGLLDMLRTGQAELCLSGTYGHICTADGTILAWVELDDTTRVRYSEFEEAE